MSAGAVTNHARLPEWSVTWVGPPGNEGPYGGVGCGMTPEEAALDVIGGLDVLKVEGEWYPPVVHVVRMGYISRALHVSIATDAQGKRCFAFRPVQPEEPTADAVHAPDPPMGPKGPTRKAVEQALAAIDKAEIALSRGRKELTHSKGPDLDEAANELSGAPADVATAVRCVAYARDLRGHRAASGAPKRPSRARIDEALAILSEELDADVVEGDGGERVVMVCPNPWWTIRLVPRAGAKSEGKGTNDRT
jgi:hypothetical protein